MQGLPDGPGQVDQAPSRSREGIVRPYVKAFYSREEAEQFVHNKPNLQIEETRGAWSGEPVWLVSVVR